MRWRGDGKELFYLGREGRFMVAKVAAGGEGLKTLFVQELFQTPLRPRS